LSLPRFVFLIPTFFDLDHVVDREAQIIIYHQLRVSTTGLEKKETQGAPKSVQL